jgi:hypothetical protein
MYVAFYFWHGVFLNDLNRISFSKVLFLGLAALVYLVISFYPYIELTNLNYYQNILVIAIFRGVVSGFMIGFVLFALVTVLGISFTKNIKFHIYH